MKIPVAKAAPKTQAPAIPEPYLAMAAAHMQVLGKLNPQPAADPIVVKAPDAQGQ